MLKFVKKPFLLYIFVLIGALNACVNRTLDRAEADRSMKVLNSDIINLLSNGSEKPEIKALQFLINQVSAPLPYIKKGKLSDMDTIPYRFDNHCGIYQWNDSLSVFEKNSDTTNIVLFFPFDEESGTNGKLIISAFESEQYSSRPEFPTLIRATMFKDDQPVLTVNHSGKLSDEIPETIQSRIEGEDYLAVLSFDRSKNEQKGDLNLDLSLNVKNYPVVAMKGYATIEYGRKSYFFKFINFELNIFNHRIEGIIDYASIDPTSHDYTNSFNKHSKLEIFEMPLKKKVGDIVLGKTDHGELLDYFVRFSNGDQILLSEYIPLIKKILNMKY